MPNTNKKVWWLCDRDHQWEDKINSRNNGTGCPVCARYANHGDSLLNKNTELSKEWHPTKNGVLTPNDVTLYSGRKVWWICKNNHEWDAVISARVRGNGCPYCSGRSGRRNLKLITENPDLPKEWHPTKNGNLTPKDVAPYSREKAWWICKNNHEWEAKINNRISGSQVSIHLRRTIVASVSTPMKIADFLAKCKTKVIRNSVSILRKICIL